MGITSRRKAEKLLIEGRVSINGQVVTTPGTKVEPGKDVIRVDGKRLKKPMARSYYLLNKPAGYICSLSDPLNRPLAGTLLFRVKERVYPAGRLDFDTEGLLILTNDGDFARLLQHPSGRCPKTYEVKVKGHPAPKDLKRLERGLVLDGKRTLPCKIKVLRKNRMTSVLSLNLYEGRKNQIKNMLSLIGHPVRKLRRTAIGPLRIDRPKLERGKFRPLTAEEIKRLQNLMRGTKK